MQHQHVGHPQGAKPIKICMQNSHFIHNFDQLTQEKPTRVAHLFIG
jgi:hypothetical protein